MRGTNRSLLGERFEHSLDIGETIAVCALLHDICKVNVYTRGTRNVKNEETGQWEKVPTFFFDDGLPYGHGEKSVYMITGFMRLTREEAFAIRYHMGFSGEENANNVGNPHFRNRLETSGNS